MTIDMPKTDYDRIRQNAQVLRGALDSLRHRPTVTRARNRTTVSEQNVKDFAIAALHECTVQNWPLPPLLALLIVELLNDPKRSPQRKLGNDAEGNGKSSPLIEFRSPCTDEERDQDHSGDFVQLRGAVEKIFPHVEAHIVSVNFVGIQTFDKAAQEEANHDVDPTGKAPSLASVKRVADKSGAARDTIRRWRRNHSYWDRVEFVRHKEDKDSTE